MLCSCRGFLDIQARHLSVFSCWEGDFRKIIQIKLSSCAQSSGLAKKLSQLMEVACFFILISEPSPVLQ